MAFPFPTEYYVKVRRGTPPIGNHLMCTYSPTSIVLYVATREPFARFVDVNQNFRRAGIFKKIRWVLRPTLMSIVHDTHWATKEDEDRILALTVSRKGFEKILETAVILKGEYKPDAEFEWEPEPDPFGEDTERFTMALKLRGLMLDRFLDTMINRVCDVTNFVRNQRRCFLGWGGVSQLQIPDESPYFLLKEFLGPLICLDIADDCDPEEMAEEPQLVGQGPHGIEGDLEKYNF